MRTFLAAILALTITSSFAAEAPIVIKFSHVVAVDTPKGKAADYFKKIAEERTKGRVKVEVYPTSQLYKDKEEMEALQLGAVQMLAPSLAKFGPLGVKEFEIFDLPYIFDNYAEVDKVMKGPIGARLFTKLETKGIKALGFWENGFKNFSSNKAVRTPEDLRGMKIRIQSSKVLDEEMRTLGALPQVMAFSEVYQALQTGVVDGTELEPSNLYTSKAFEVQKNLTLTGHGFLGYAVIVNKTFWESLPADIRTILTTAMNDSSTYANQIAKQETDKALAAIKASGKTTIYTPTAAERAAFRKALIPVHQKMASRFGQDLLTEIYKETAFKPVE